MDISSSEEVTLNKYLVSADICAPVLAIAEQEQLSIDPLLQGLDISAADIRNPEYLLHTDNYLKFIANVLHYSHNPSPGLTAGLMASFQALSIIGLAILSAPKYRDALKLGIKYSGISGSIGQCSYIEEGDRAAFQLELASMDIPLKQYLVDDQFASIYSYQVAILGDEYQLITGTKVVAEEINFAYPEPENLDHYKEIFGCKLVFDAAYNRMWFAKEQLDASLRLSNKLAFDMCDEQCRKLQNKRKIDDSLVSEIEAILVLSPQLFPTIDEIAGQLKMTGRSLRRKLSQAGYTYSKLLENVKCELAIDLLANPALSISEIGDLLGYSEATNFRRAFRLWKGLSPSQYRKN